MLTEDLPREADDVERELATLAAHLDAATHRMLALVRRFDELGAWAATGARSCAHWLSWRVGLAPGAAPAQSGGRRGLRAVCLGTAARLGARAHHGRSARGRGRARHEGFRGRATRSRGNVTTAGRRRGSVSREPGRRA